MGDGFKSSSLDPAGNSFTKAARGSAGCSGGAANAFEPAAAITAANTARFFNMNRFLRIKAVLTPPRAGGSRNSIRRQRTTGAAVQWIGLCAQRHAGCALNRADD